MSNKLDLYKGISVKLSKENYKAFEEIKCILQNQNETNKEISDNKVAQVVIEAAYKQRNLINKRVTEDVIIDKELINDFLKDIKRYDRLRVELLLIYDFGYISLKPDIPVIFTEKSTLRFSISNNAFVEINVEDISVTNYGKETDNKEKEFLFDRRIEDTENNYYIVEFGHTYNQNLRKSAVTEKMTIKPSKTEYDDFIAKLEELNKKFQVYGKGKTNRSEVIRLSVEYISNNRYLLNKQNLAIDESECLNTMVFTSIVTDENSSIPIQLIVDDLTFNIPGIMKANLQIEHNEEWLYIEISKSYAVNLRIDCITKITAINKVDNLEYYLDKETNLQDVEYLKVYLEAQL